MAMLHVDHEALHGGVSYVTYAGVTLLELGSYKVIDELVKTNIRDKQLVCPSETDGSVTIR